MCSSHDSCCRILLTQSLGELGRHLCHGLVVLHGAAGHAHPAHHGPARAPQRQPAGEGDEAGVGVLDVVEAAPGLRQRADGLRVHLEEGGGLGLLDCDIHTSQPRPVHSLEQNSECIKD